MPTEIYIEALLVDDDIVDRVWRQWAESYITDDLAMFAWFLIRENARDAKESVADNRAWCQ